MLSHFNHVQLSATRWTVVLQSMYDLLSYNTLRTGVNDTSNKDILLVYFYKVSQKNVIT